MSYPATASSLIDVRFLIPHAPAHIHRRAQHGDAQRSLGLFKLDRVVVHAERVGQERLAEEVAVEIRLELELEEVIVQVVNDVGFPEADPAGRLAREPLCADRRASRRRQLLPPIKPS